MINGNDYIKNIQKERWKYKMLSLDDIVSNKKENKDTTGSSWPFRRLITGPSGSGKTNTLLHLINNFHPIDKIHLYAKDTDLKKCQFLINKREQAGISSCIYRIFK